VTIADAERRSERETLIPGTLHARSCTDKLSFMSTEVTPMDVFQAGSDNDSRPAFSFVVTVHIFLGLIVALPSRHLNQASSVGKGRHSEAAWSFRFRGACS